MPFVDTSDESVWKQGHIPGAINLPAFWDETDPTKPRFQETTLSKVVDRTEEFVLYWCEPGVSWCNVAYDATKAVAWGYQKVYWLERAQDWEEAGYPLEQDE